MPDVPQRRRTDPARSQLRRPFLEELNAIEGHALGGIAIVVEQLDRATQALIDRDVALATIVVADGARLDARYADVNQGLLSLLARQAPVAGDLRLVAGLLHLIKHMERMGDQCVNIAKLVPLCGHDGPRRDEVIERLAEMSRIVRGEVVQARQAFELRDVDLASHVVDDDRQVNVLNREIFRLAVDLGDEAEVREWLLTMAMVARAFERIGDNAVDIADLVSFVADGYTREHGDGSAER